MQPATLDRRTQPGPMERPLRVVIAEDAYLVREAVELILSTAPEIDVVRAVGDGSSLLAAVDELEPDVVSAAPILYDLRGAPIQPGFSGFMWDGRIRAWVLWRDGCPEGETPSAVGERADRALDRLRAAEGHAIALHQRWRLRDCETETPSH